MKRSFAALAPCDQGTHRRVLHDIMGRTSGAVAKSQVRIVDPLGFAEVARALVERGVWGEVGVRAVSRATGLPASRLSEWMQGRRHALSREHFLRLNDAVTYSTEGEISLPGGLGVLWRSVGEPLDELGFFPSPSDTRGNGPFDPPARFLEDLIGETAVAHLRRGTLPARESKFWHEDLGLSPVWITPEAFDSLGHLGVSLGFEGDRDGVAIFETEKGARCKVWFNHGAIERPATASGRRDRARRR